jgi:hypothetical protein
MTLSNSFFAVLVTFAASSTCLTPAAAAQLIVVEDNRCEPCIRFERSVGNYYDSTPQGRKAPLRRVNIAAKVPGDLANITIQGSIRGTPTFVLIDSGREIGMFDGFPSSEIFWQRIDGLLQQVH